MQSLIGRNDPQGDVVVAVESSSFRAKRIDQAFVNVLRSFYHDIETPK